jgi:hypothetical protein
VFEIWHFGETAPTDGRAVPEAPYAEEEAAAREQLPDAPAYDGLTLPRGTAIPACGVQKLCRRPPGPVADHLDSVDRVTPINHG